MSVQFDPHQPHNVTPTQDDDDDTVVITSTTGQRDTLESMNDTETTLHITSEEMSKILNPSAQQSEQQPPSPNPSPKLKPKPKPKQGWCSWALDLAYRFFSWLWSCFGSSSRKNGTK